MLYFRFIYIIPLLFIGILKCSYNGKTPDSDQKIMVDSSPYKKQKAMEKIQNNDINEASGIAASQSFPGYFWVHNDSGDKARLFLIDSLGNGRIEFEVTSTTNRDWEDIAIFKDPITNRSTIVVAEMGDNVAQHQEYSLLLIEEPKILPSKKNTSLTVTKKINFTYPDGPRDAEALMIDPYTNDIFIVSKREANVSLYRIAFPYKLEETMITEKVLTLPLTFITAGDISENGEEILIKNYDSIYYFSRKQNETVIQAMTKTPIVIPYVREPQGEAICFGHDGKSFYTVSEKTSMNISPILYKFMKK
jgi:hypothetical protein